MREQPATRGAPRRARAVAAGIALGYMALGAAWISLSDRLALAITATPDQLARVQAYKGIAYVAVTGALLYFLVHHFLGALEASNRELSRQRDRLLELGRVQALVRAVNATLLRVSDEELLLRAACRVTVREGGFPHAWIGLVDARAGRLERVAHASEDLAAGPVEATSMALDSDERSAIGDALADGQPHAARGRADPWLNRTVPAGIAFEGALALPLRAGDEVAGVVAIYGRSSDDLEDPEEVRLLAEVADNIGLGIGYLRQRRAVHQLTYHDELTGVGNRYLLDHRLVAALNNAQQRHTAVAVIVLDIDRFRETNDTGGREAGDRVLQATAQILGGVIRPGDTIARLGNDEFALIFADLPGVEMAGQLTDRVADRFPERIEAAGIDVYLSVSMGVAVYPDDGTSAQEVLARAELALHSQSGDQPGTVTYYAPELDQHARERRELELALRTALRANELHLAWQPIVDLESGATVAAEGLLRWHSARLGPVPPDRFIPVAEHTGLIVAIGVWVIEQACATARTWATAGHAIDVSVNVALQQLQDPGFVADVRRTLAEHEPQGWRLVLELTESEFMADPEPVAQACRSLKDMGCAIHIDDFGTGYSALNYLTHLPLDGLKIDRSFVAQVDTDRGVQAVTRAVLALAAGLDLDVIAEGVETPHQLEVVRGLGCTRVQGFLFDRPMEAAALGERLQAASDTGDAGPAARGR